jgi:hypothetical protein
VCNRHSDARREVAQPSLRFGEAEEVAVRSVLGVFLVDEAQSAAVEGVPLVPRDMLQVVTVAYAAYADYYNPYSWSCYR